jgi:hypothetical protein
MSSWDLLSNDRRARCRGGCPVSRGTSAAVATASSLPEPAGSLISVRPILVGENRTEAEFVAQLDGFAADARQRWETFVAIKELEHRPALLKLELLNETDDNFEDVVLEVLLPLPRARVDLSASEAEEMLRPPEAPPEWGSGALGSIPVVRAADKASLGAEAVVRGEAETLVRFWPMRARPHTRHTLPEVMLVLAPEMADQRIEADWRATSSSTRGQTRGTVEIEVVLGESASGWRTTRPHNGSAPGHLRPAWRGDITRVACGDPAPGRPLTLARRLAAGRSPQPICSASSTMIPSGPRT